MIKEKLWQLVDARDNGDIDEKTLISAFEEAGMKCCLSEWIDDICGGHVHTIFSGNGLVAEKGEYGWSLR